MIRVAIGITILFSGCLFGFEIKTVDLTDEDNKKSNLPYFTAKDGKKVLNDIRKSVKPLENQIVRPMEASIVYPYDSNSTQKDTSAKSSNKEIKSKAENDIDDVFSSFNEQNKTEKILKDIRAVELKEETTKAKPINLEK